MKICRICNQKVNLSEFYKDKKSPDNLSYKCKKCTAKVSKQYRHQPKGFISKIYSTQIRSSKVRGMPPPNYTKDELNEWLHKTPLFLELFNEWKESGFLKNKAPSIDRIDDYKPYTFNNIRLVTWEINCKKSHQDRKSGKNTKHSKSVRQLNLFSNEHTDYISINQAGRETGINPSSICRVCQGKGRLAGGYRWKFLP